MRRSVDEVEAAVPTFAWPNYVLGNHDQWRLASRLGGQPQARLAAVLLLTLRGTPTLYYGDELGLENGIIPADAIQDPQGRNLGPERSRDVARTPMQWDDGPYAGFSDAEPWLPVSADHRGRNVTTLAADPCSILNLYRRLLRLRRSMPALHLGSYRPLDLDPDCYVYIRERNGVRVLVALNFAGKNRTLCLPELDNGRVLLSTHMDRAGSEALRKIELRACEGIVVAL
jgi:alpha-glucosidase